MAQVALRKVFRGNGLMRAIFQTSGTNLLVMTLTMLSSILTSRMFGVEGKGAFLAILFSACALNRIGWIWTTHFYHL